MPTRPPARPPRASLYLFRDHPSSICVGLHLVARLDRSHARPPPFFLRIAWCACFFFQCLALGGDKLEASAKQMAVLEEQLIFEQSRAGSLKEKLGKESERREAVQGELDTTKQVL